MSTATTSPSSSCSSVVRTRIATLEAQKETASRTTMTSSSPGRTSILLRRAAAQRVNAEDAAKEANNVSIDSAHISTTAAASRNRRSRLSKQTAADSFNDSMNRLEQSTSSSKQDKTAITTTRNNNFIAQQKQRSLETRRLMGLANVPPPDGSSVASYASSSNIGPPQGPAVSLFAHHSAKKLQQQKEKEHQDEEHVENLLAKTTIAPISVNSRSPSPATTRIGKIQRLRLMRTAASNKEENEITGEPELEKSDDDLMQQEPAKIPLKHETRLGRRPLTPAKAKLDLVNNRQQQQHQHQIQPSTPSWRATANPRMPPAPAPAKLYEHHEAEEEKSSKAIYTNRIMLAPSSSSDFDSSSRSHSLQQHQPYGKAIYGRERLDDRYHEEQQDAHHAQNNLQRLLPHDTSLSTSQMTPEVAAFFDRSLTATSAVHHHQQGSDNGGPQHPHPIYNIDSKDTQLTTYTDAYYSPQDKNHVHDDDTYDYSGHDDPHQYRDSNIYSQRHGSRQNSHQGNIQRNVATSLKPSALPKLSLRDSQTMDNEDEDEDYHEHNDDHQSSNNFGCYSSNRQHISYSHQYRTDHDTVDDDDDGSISYSRRTRHEQEAHLRTAAAQKPKAEMLNNRQRTDGSVASLLIDTTHDNNDGSFVNLARARFGTPAVQTACGVAAAATAGCLLMGPVGLLVGAAAVGIGVGVLQIPPEQRENMQYQAVEACRGAQDHVMNVSETISNSCANTYTDSGIADHVPTEMKQCCEAIDEEVTKVVQSSGKMQDGVLEEENSNPGTDAANRKVQGRVAGGDVSRTGGRKAVDAWNIKAGDTKCNLSPARSRNQKNSVLCLKDGPVIPVCQIHALSPAEQPRAWLDVLANAPSTDDEKLEALEEIAILAKDKVYASIFLDEGVLDSLMWIIERFLEKLEYNNVIHRWTNPTITKQEAETAKLAASCCLTLGKSHCASVHTGGDLLLMSQYDRGTVPEERQLAQMFHEVAYHSRLIKPDDDPTLINSGNEMFTVNRLSLPLAEELAKKITLLSEGQIQSDKFIQSK
ncbi:hypothetical protein MPSEU_000526500 [Mayamaea pseudoterrestris]|nr:hypothetical protein MPSEU_000526500 [Mayamaea pseudoterrestris]